MSTISFYRQQAERHQGDADAADLVNVRQRHQRSANAWSALADNLQNIEVLRAEKAAIAGAALASASPNENPDRGKSDVTEPA